MPEHLAVISSESPRPLSPITEALARRLDQLLDRIAKTQTDATLYIEIRAGKLHRYDIKQGGDLSDAQ